MGTGDRGCYTMALGINEGTIGMDALSMTFEVMKTRKVALARGVGALIRFSTERIVSLDVRLWQKVSARGNAT